MGLFERNQQVTETVWALVIAIATPLVILFMIISGWMFIEPVKFHDINNEPIVMKSTWITDLVPIVWVAASCAYQWATFRETELGPGKITALILIS